MRNSLESVEYKQEANLKCIFREALKWSRIAARIKRLPCSTDINFLHIFLYFLMYFIYYIVNFLALQYP